jgi:hypothetical protein
VNTEQRLFMRPNDCSTYRPLRMEWMMWKIATPRVKIQVSLKFVLNMLAVLSSRCSNSLLITKHLRSENLETVAKRNSGIVKLRIHFVTCPMLCCIV